MHLPSFLLSAGLARAAGAASTSAHRSPSGALCRTAVECTGSGGARVVVDGDLDHVSAPEVDLLLTGLALHGVRHVTVDAAGVAFIDSGGLAVLERHTAALAARGGSLVVTCASPPVTRLVRLVGDATLVLRRDGGDRAPRAS